MPLLANIPPPPFPGVEIGPLDLRFYGLLIAIGAYLGLLLMTKRYQEAGGEPDLAERTALLGIGSAIVGSRIGYVLPRLDHFLDNPLEIVAIWQGGLAFFGGVALAVPVCWWYVHRSGGDVTAMIDAAAPALPLAHAIGRWGNYFNQELFGRPTDLPWALRVEVERIPGHVAARFPDATTFHPTFLYESLWNLGLVALILAADRRRVDGQRWLRRGSLGFLYLAGYGVGRFWTEWLRVDVPETYLGLSRNSWNALLVFVIGVVGLLWWERRGRAAADPEQMDEDPGEPEDLEDDEGSDAEGSENPEAADDEDDVDEGPSDEDRSTR